MASQTPKTPISTASAMELPIRLATNAKATAPVSALPANEPPTQMATTAMSSAAMATAPINESPTTMDTTSTAGASNSAAPANESPTTMETTATTTTTTNTTTTNIVPPLHFLTPTALQTHLNASLPLPSHLTLRLGTTQPPSTTLLPLPHLLSLLESEMSSWAHSLVRITKLPDFSLRTILFDMSPRLKGGAGGPAIHRLFTRASAAVWKREREMGRGVSEVVFQVRGWREGGEEVRGWCVGVGVVVLEEEGV